jgi:hypothetical protein
VGRPLKDSADGVFKIAPPQSRGLRWAFGRHGVGESPTHSYIIPSLESWGSRQHIRLKPQFPTRHSLNELFSLASKINSLNRPLWRYKPYTSSSLPCISTSGTTTDIDITYSWTEYTRIHAYFVFEGTQF